MCLFLFSGNSINIVKTMADALIIAIGKIDNLIVVPTLNRIPKISKSLEEILIGFLIIEKVLVKITMQVGITKESEP